MSDKIQWCGKTTSFHHKQHDTQNPDGVKTGFRQVWFLDAQWSTCPIEVENEVKRLWNDYALGNDNYIIKTTLADLGKSYVAIRQYVKEVNPKLGNNEIFIIHWWW